MISPRRGSSSSRKSSSGSSSVRCYDAEGNRIKCPMTKADKIVLIVFMSIIGVCLMVWVSLAVWSHWRRRSSRNIPRFEPVPAQHIDEGSPFVPEGLEEQDNSVKTAEPPAYSFPEKIRRAWSNRSWTSIKGSDDQPPRYSSVP